MEYDVIIISPIPASIARVVIIAVASDVINVTAAAAVAYRSNVDVAAVSDVVVVSDAVSCSADCDVSVIIVVIV